MDSHFYFQICGKINRELVYARQDLMKAVETGADSKVINKRRKRVQWLENRLEKIIIQHSPARQVMGGNKYVKKVYIFVIQSNSSLACI